IGLICLGLHPSMPKFDWNSGETLLQKLGSASNLYKAGGLFLWVLGSLLLAGLLGGKRFDARIVTGLIAVMAISMFAQVFTGNATVKDLGIEIVLFSLLLGL